MITKLSIEFPIDPIVAQVKAMGYFDKSVILNETNGKLLSGPYQTKEEFKGTPLGNVLDSLGSIGEARLLRLGSAESYTAHSDPDDRLHLAITTNPYCYLIDFDNNINYHIPVDGRIYLMDTSYVHIAGNFGGRDRIHLNIRVPLPEFNYPGYRLGIRGGEFDWKQESYIVIMSFFNKAIKKRIITGFEKINDKEVFINCNDLTLLSPYIDKLKNKGFEVFLKET